MLNRFLNSTKTITGRLAVFFTTISIILGAVTFLVFIVALHWSEDQLGERRLLIDRDEASARFKKGESGEIKIDALTMAYNDINLLPKPYKSFALGKESFLGEVGEALNPLPHMMYIGQYYIDGKKMPLILLAQSDKVGLGRDDFIFSGAIVVSLVTVLMLIFSGLLYRLSKHLIEPVNSIARQLEQLSGESLQSFEISASAAIEFQILTQRLNTYRSEIQQLIKREQAFSRYASHELRTPLTIIKGSSDLLTKSKPTTFQHKQIKRIKNASYQMGTMTDALLGLVRYERDKEALESRYFSEQELQQIVQQNLAQAVDKNIDVQVSVESEPKIEASSAVINMILGNLLRNAIAATNAGKVTITLSHSALIITDEGQGITQSPSDQGHGLGLLIVDDFCQRFGWKFSLKNREQHGCQADILFK